MSVRRSFVYTGLALSFSILCFALGSFTANRLMARQLAKNDAQITALRNEIAHHERTPEIVPTSGSQPAPSDLVAEVKKQLQSEMGLLPVQLLRDRRASFVELNAVDNYGKTSYGTAGYLGRGYFITVKHGVVALDEDEGRTRRIVSVTIKYKGRDLPVSVVDTGDADVEVHPGDWAIVKVKESVDLPALRINTGFGYEFADPIFRLGNDYSKGIILGTGYVGQRTSNGLVTCLTDGHPGVSGGGVLNQSGDLVGIPIGRMQGDYRFSFILPVRAEMFRKVPAVKTEAAVGSAD
jgi:hypothetical protein